MYKADVLKHYKSLRAIADTLGITVSAVSQWKTLVPPISARALADKTPGLTFDPHLYRRSSPEMRRRAAALGSN